VNHYPTKQTTLCAPSWEGDWQDVVSTSPETDDAAVSPLSLSSLLLLLLFLLPPRQSPLQLRRLS
jgi:hypothetical protein